METSQGSLVRQSRSRLAASLLLQCGMETSQGSLVRQSRSRPESSLLLQCGMETSQGSSETVRSRLAASLFCLVLLTSCIGLLPVAERIVSLHSHAPNLSKYTTI
ncbi:hypothetical protein ACOMHN_051768 [Nucella lapillus]